MDEDDSFFLQNKIKTILKIQLGSLAGNTTCHQVFRELLSRVKPEVVYPDARVYSSNL